MKQPNFVKSSKGMTLIEILASITILTIIALSFFTFFTQSAHTNRMSEDMLDATYLAQQEMEKVYNLSRSTGDLSQATNALSANEYGYRAGDGKRYTYVKESDPFLVQLYLRQMEEDTTNELATVRITVNDLKTNQLKAKMQSILAWED